MRAAEVIGHAVEFAFSRWPRAAICALFAAPLWLKAGLQLWRHITT